MYKFGGVLHLLTPIVIPFTLEYARSLSRSSTKQIVENMLCIAVTTIRWVNPTSAASWLNASRRQLRQITTFPLSVSGSV